MPGRTRCTTACARHGGFEHNLQSLRVVDALEQRYPRFDGLNLSFETREGILKHCSRAQCRAAGARRTRRRRPALPATARSPSLEAQLVNLADEMAYNAHDIDDGVRSGPARRCEQLLDVPLYRRFRDEALAEFPALAAPAAGGCCSRVIRRMRRGAGRRPGRPARGRCCASMRRRTPTRCGARRRWWPSARRCAGQQRAEALPVRRAVPPCAGAAEHRARAPGGGRAVRGLCATARRDAARARRAAAARARGGRLHRRHDRPLRAARTPAPDRPGAVRRCGLSRGRAAEPMPRAMARLRRLVVPGQAAPPGAARPQRASRCSSTTTTGACTWPHCRTRCARQAVVLHAYALLDNEVQLLLRAALGGGAEPHDAGAGPPLRGRASTAAMAAAARSGKGASAPAWCRRARTRCTACCWSIRCRARRGLAGVAAGQPLVERAASPGPAPRPAGHRPAGVLAPGQHALRARGRLRGACWREGWTPAQVRRIEHAAASGWALGSPQFLADMAQQLGRPVRPRAKGRPPRRAAGRLKPTVRPDLARIVLRLSGAPAARMHR